MKLEANLPKILLIGLLLAAAVAVFHYRSYLAKIHPGTIAQEQAIMDKFLPVQDFRKLSYQQQLDLIKSYSQSDPGKSWSYLKSAFLVNGQQVVNAHQFAHLVGNGMFAKYGLEGITKCDETFAFGCFHGVTQQLLEQKGVSVIKEIQDRCLKIFPPDKTQKYTGCIHGMGHGILTWERFQVPIALADCGELIAAYQNYCFDGVFMEHASDLAVNEFDPNHPWQFCSQLDAQYHYNCARYQSQVFLMAFGSNIPKIGANCAAGPDETLRSTCFESLGFYITQSNMGALSQVLKECDQIKGAGSYHCKIGAIREVTFQSYPDWQQTSKALCLSLPENWQSKCANNEPMRPM
ncbi:MAG: hypothetical protein ABI643_03855 [Candidatus Doudnabacteria bacterium]